MKRMMLQIFRFLVTMVIFGSMAGMIFSQRAEINSLKEQLREARAGH